MPVTIALPQVGESVVEGTIGKWLKKPGDRIARYEPLVEVITDKVTMELPSPVAGSLVRILAQEGQTLPMGAPIAEVAAIVADQAFQYLDAPIARLCGPDVPTMPFAATLEEAYMPNTEKIAAALRQLAAY